MKRTMKHYPNFTDRYIDDCNSFWEVIMWNSYKGTGTIE